MTITLKQGIPRHSFFVAAVPKMNLEEPLVPGQTKVIMTNPKTSEQTEALYYGKWGKMNENEFCIANTFCLLAYGGGVKFVLPELKKQYPELQKNFEIEYWILKEVKPNNQQQ